ncbi:MAG: glycosyltransferase family 2 protein [Patescibacteria group bacterium]|jgi:hypothetical protein
MKLSIIILNYKTRGLLKQCIRGIQEYTQGYSSELIVVDNASHDGTREMMQEEFPSVVFIETKKNLGFGAGMNAGMNIAHGDYFLLLNTDIAILDDAIQRLVAYMDQHPRVGIAGPRLMNPDGSVQYSCYRFPSFFTALWRRSPFGKLSSVRHLLKTYVMADFDHASSRPVDWILGACMIVRKEALQRVGMFDERFFLYVEDTDWCRRFWEQKWEVHYSADAEIVHYHGRQSAENPGISGIFSYATRVHILSWMKYFLKYAGVPLPRK